ncbi:MAG: radical SAM protein [Chitinispirillia bacterium]|jgi:radical SAM superfamily enzyme YgiQ (UPF0313 family)
MRILFFNPRGYDNSSKKNHIYRLAVNLPPLGIASISAVIRNNGHKVKIFDAYLNSHINNAEWIRKILNFSPDFVAFSTITSTFIDAYEICNGIKQQQDSIKTVFGGVHVSWGKDKILSMFSAIDFIIAGEGEYSLLALLNNEPYKNISGLFYRNGSKIEHGPIQRKKHLCEMDDLPFPAYDLLESFPGKYNMALFSYPRHPGTSVISSRGCVYTCAFCDRSVYGNTYRWNSPEYTIELMRWLHTDFKIKHVTFYDDLFTLNRNRVTKLCYLLRKSNLKISFNCIARIGYIDKTLIHELKSAGCWMVHVGIESGDQNILDVFKTGLTIDKIRSDIYHLYNNGLWVKGLFIMGFPGETKESIGNTIDFACSLPLKDANFTAFTPFPGAPVSEKINFSGTFNKDWKNWPKMDCINFVFVPKEINSKKILQDYNKKFIKKFYHRPFMKSVYRKMIFQSPHSYWRLIKNLSSFRQYAKELKVES